MVTPRVVCKKSSVTLELRAHRNEYAMLFLWKATFSRQPS